MTGRQIAFILALCLVLPVLCGAIPQCQTSSADLGKLCTFVAGGMIGIIKGMTDGKLKDTGEK